MPDQSSVNAYTFGLLHDIGDGAQAERKSEVEALLDRLQAHDAAERAGMRGYEEAATVGPDPGVRYLMSLILEEEKRHDELLTAMANEVRRSLVWEQGERPLPSISATGEERKQLLSQAERFLEAERSGKRQLDTLQHAVHTFDRGQGILSLVVEMMAFDTQKHIAILDYIRKHLQN
jgi:hypothetical protein